MSSLARAFSVILFPVEFNQTMRGSVSVLEPAPSERGDLLVNSCKASDAAMNTKSSGKDGTRHEEKIARLANSEARMCTGL